MLVPAQKGSGRRRERLRGAGGGGGHRREKGFVLIESFSKSY